MGALLTRDGRPSQRNLGKPYRPQSYDHKRGEVKWSDRMRLGAYGQEVNTTGSFGVVSNFGVRGKAFGPQKGKRRSVKRKRVARTVSNGQLIQAQYHAVEWLISLRSQLLVVKTLSEFSNRDLMGDYLRTGFEKVSASLRMRLTPIQLRQMYEREEHTVNSLLGRLEKEGMGVVKLRRIHSKLTSALKMI